MTHLLRTLYEPLRQARRHGAIVHGFVTKEVSGRYAGSYAGLFWVVLEPLCTILVYSLVFSYVFRVSLDPVRDGTLSFTVYFLAGYFPWLIFSDGLCRAAGSVVGNGTLVTKVIFPVELLPLSSFLCTYLTHGVGFLFYLIYLVFLGKTSLSWIFLPLFILFHCFFCCGLCFLVSALVVFVRDIQQSLNLLLMVWFYATPILYPMDLVPEALRGWITFNPMTLLVVPLRQLLLIGYFDRHLLAEFALVSVVIYSMGTWFFMRSKRAFADVL